MTPTCSILPDRLRCEHRRSPECIDSPNPRLSWIAAPTDPAARGQRQAAYHILAASSYDLLEQGRGDLWDTGWVESSDSLLVPYAGKALSSGQDVCWAVRLRDESGAESPWAASEWSMGLLEPSDWKAQWIEEPDPLGFERTYWVGTGVGEAHKSVPAGRRCFRKAIATPPGERIAQCRVLVAADESFKLSVNGKEALSGGIGPDGRIKPERADITGAVAPEGENLFAICLTTTKEGPAGLAGKIALRFESGRQLVQPLDRSWLASEAPPADCCAPGVDESSYKPAVEIAHVGQTDHAVQPWTPWGIPGQEDDLVLPPPPYFHKEFHVGGPVERAVLYIAAQGGFEAVVNGVAASDEYFAPGWPAYERRIFHRRYEVTDLLEEGPNAIGLILMDTWYSGYVAWCRQRNRYRGDAKVVAQLHLEYRDGTTEIVGTDDSWLCGYGGIQAADLLMGEEFDARKVVPGWGTPEFEAPEDWAAPALSFPPAEPIVAHPGDPLRPQEEIVPRAVTQPEPGRFVFDLGQNMVGVVRLRVEAPEGARIQLRYAEVLQEDGTLYTEALRSARAVDSYICAGGGEEVWSPLGTFHGFRYVEVSGYPGIPPLDAVVGIVVHSDCERVGTFDCSDIRVNRLMDNVLWGQKGNYVEIPTDCPQRDERLGWTGDAQVFMRTGTYNMDAAAFFTKWLQDLFDDQNEDGSVPNIAPNPFGYGDQIAPTGWGDAAVVCPWTMWQVYGDLGVVRKHWGSMKAYMKWVVDTADDYVRPEWGFGDWLSLCAKTPLSVIGTAYLAWCATMMAEMAEAIGEPADAEHFRAVHQKTREAFRRAFVKPGFVESESQTAYLLALQSGVLDPEEEAVAVQRLLRDLYCRGWHFSTGFLGVRELLPVLSRFGHTETAYKLLLTDTFPSWLFEVANGATTIWERWDGWTPEFGFQDVGMNSFNHYAYGAVAEWVYRTAAGIDLAAPGHAKVRIAPEPDDRLTHASASCMTPRGLVACQWRRAQGGTLHLSATVPPGAEGEIRLPVGDPSRVLESGKPLEQAEGLSIQRVEKDAVVLSAVAGCYRFAIA